VLSRAADPGFQGTNGLEALLAGAPDLATAVDVTLDYLLACDLPMPSLYLARGDRLRCLAQRGYWQVQDGLPISAGVAGNTYRSGTSVRVRTADTPNFIGAVPGICEEVCAPIRVAGDVVGILNVESLTVLPARALPIVEECARLFGERLAELGGPPEESAADQLGRHAVRMAAMGQIEELSGYVVNAARDVTRMSSGAMIELGSTGAGRVTAAVGAIGARLHDVPAADWATIASQVRHGSSCYTAGSDDGAAFIGYQALRNSGAQALIIAPVFAAGECRAMLVCADDGATAPETVLVGRLELLAAQLGSCLQTLGALEELRGRTMQDPLTELGNRTWFVQKVQERLAAWSAEGNGQFAVLFCDLDGFKDVNDSLGHAAGDRLLVTVAARMREKLHPHELLARLGGDEFAICSDQFPSVADVIRRAADLPTLLSPHLDLDGIEVGITASVGIAIANSAGLAPPDTATLLREADTAMYEAKRRGRSGVALYTETLRREAAERLSTVTGLRDAVADNQLVLFYQPIVALATGEIGGVEALLRWNHPQRGLLGPTDFLMIAEDTGLILQLGSWALQQACLQLASWDRSVDGFPPLDLGVNLSGRQLSDPGLPTIIESAVAASGLDPARLILEITESTLMQDVTSARFLLDTLKHLGVGIAIDDFGTGFSSLAQLKRFPVDTIKIDRSFVEGLPDDAELRAIVAAIAAMAKALGLDLIAEGVETVEQRDSLADLGCRHAQGHLFAQAQPADAMSQLLANGRLLPGTIGLSGQQAGRTAAG
jgi:diguanylate cyclase (GGDEF)-like protein